MRMLVVSMVILACAAARAELPPDAYRDMQARAPEVVELRVDRVDTSICWFWLCDGRDVTVAAEVIAVVRTASGLKPGARIELRYRHVDMDGRSGPRPIPIVRAGTTLPAFLVGTDDGHYSPAARGASFAPVDSDRPVP